MGQGDHERWEPPPRIPRPPDERARVWAIVKAAWKKTTPTDGEPRCPTT
jgi:hypothetical protein